MEPHRASPLCLHLPELARQAARQPPRHHPADRRHYHQYRPYRHLRHRPKLLSKRYQSHRCRNGCPQHSAQCLPRRLELHHLSKTTRTALTRLLRISSLARPNRRCLRWVRREGAAWVCPLHPAFATARSQAVNYPWRTLAPARREGSGAMGSLRWALSWLIVVVVGLAPILVYWVAGLISGSFQRRHGEDRRGGGRPVKKGKRA